MAIFSVIISVYNKEDYVQNTIKSVLAQTIDDIEIIVINDGSSDASLDKINSIEDERINVFSTENQGASKARNLGIEKASADYIALLDGDDYWHPYYLEEITLLQTKFPSQKVFVTAIELQTTGFTYPASYSVENKTHQVIDYFKGSQLRTLISSSSVVIHQDVFKHVGVFDPSIISGQDTDLWIRIGLDYPIAFSKRICARYIDVSTSLSNTTINVNHKCKFDQFEEQEKDNYWLKRFLDMNRYSMAILSKLSNDMLNFNYFTGKLDYRNLNWKQKLSLKLNRWSLKKLIQFKNYLKKRKIILTVFK